MVFTAFNLSAEDQLKIADFESGSNYFTKVSAGQVDIHIVDNPSISSINSSAKVLQFTYYNGYPNYAVALKEAGTSPVLPLPIGIIGEIVARKYRYVHLKLYKPFTSKILLTLKKTGISDGQTPQYLNKKINEWEDITIDMLDVANGSSVAQNTIYDGIMLTLDKSGRTPGSTAGFVAYIDDLYFSNSNVSVSTTTTASSLGLKAGTDLLVLRNGNLTVDVPTIINSITIERGGEVSNSSSLTTSTFSINSDATGTGTYVDNGTTNINGTVNVQQYLTGASGASTRGWWYIASPVSGATSTIFDVSNITPVNKLWYYTENTNSEPTYTKVTTNETTLSPGVGYVAYIGGSDRIYTFSTSTGASTSKLNSGVITLTPTRTGVTEAKRGFNLVGNPYPCYLDWNAVEKTNMRSTMWYRTYTGHVMEFDTFDGSVGTSNGVNGLVTQFIPPMQAFWTKVDADGSNGSLIFRNTMCSHKDVSNNLLRTHAVNNPQVLRLKVSNGTNSDETLVVTNANAWDGYDSYDSPKMSNDNVEIPEIYTLVDREETVINNLNNISANKEVALGFKTGMPNTFTIKATEITNFDVDIKIVLRDNQINTEQDLTDGTAYTFSSDVANTSSRFSILFKSVSVTTGINNKENDNQVVIYYESTKNQIIVNRDGAIDKEGIITVCNALGQRLISTKTKGTSTTINNSCDSGVYLVTVNVGGRNITKKVIIY